MNKRFAVAAFLLFSGLLVAGLMLATGPVEGQPHAGAKPIEVNAEPIWGTDIMVNPTVSGTPATFLNHSLAINPANPDIVMGSFDSPYSSQGIVGYSWSTNKGRTWRGGYFRGPWDGDLMTSRDTHVAFDANGVGYFTTLVAGSNLSGFYVLTTTNGTAWGTPVPVAIADYSESRYISHLVIDTMPGSPYVGSIYMFWLFSNNIFPYWQGIRMRYSRDGGLTWSNDIQVSDPGFEISHGVQAAIASDGTVYAAYYELENNFIYNQPKLLLDRSTNGGVSWGEDQLISGAPINQMGRPDYKDRELTLVGNVNALECTLAHVRHYPSIAVLPTNPDKVFAVWNDGRWEDQTTLCGIQGRHSDIAYSSSGDGGQTWTAPVRINDDPINNGIDQFHPAIAVRPDGLLGVTWIDRRYDPSTYLYDLAYTQSTDGGTNWSTNRRVSDFSSDPNHSPDYKGLDELGLRNALVMGPDYVLPAWLDTHIGTREAYFHVDLGLFPTPNATPTRTPTIIPTSTRTPNPILVGHVNWQSRPAQPHPLQQLPVTLTLKLGTTEVNYPSQTTDASGFYTVSVSGLAPGIYTWRAKGPKYIANSGTVNIALRVSDLGINPKSKIQNPKLNVDMGLFRSGDANDDNVVGIVDFNIVKVSFNKSIGDPGYDDRADFTGDQSVNIVDFNALKVNYGSSGAPPIGPSER